MQAGELYGKSSGKDGAFAAAAAADAARLLRAQIDLENEARQKGAYQGLSVADTIAKAVLAGNTRAVAALRSDFKARACPPEGFPLRVQSLGFGT